MPLNYGARYIIFFVIQIAKTSTVICWQSLNFIISPLQLGVINKSEIHPTHIGAIEQSVQGFLKKQTGRQLFLICDSNTVDVCLPLMTKVFSKYSITGHCVIPAGERFKTLETCQVVWEKMLEAKLDRDALVINLGGGVVGDLGGFCAGSWKRGLGFVHIPTTLLAMTDAALGGKTGVDFRGVKNMIGLFRQPEAVFVDTAFLNTLPREELKSGMAEVVKHAFIAAPHLFDVLKKMDAPERANWSELLPASIDVKMQVVQKDEQEVGIRKILNFGHTIGHAIEAYSHNIGEPITHGHAIALGMIDELYRAEGASLRFKELEAFVLKNYSTFNIPKGKRAFLWDFMKNDKKNVAEEVRFVVPGEAAFTMEEHTLTKDAWLF